MKKQFSKCPNMVIEGIDMKGEEMILILKTQEQDYCYLKQYKEQEQDSDSRIESNCDPNLKQFLKSFSHNSV